MNPISWNTHSIITTFALAECKDLYAPVQITPLEDFLSKAQEAVKMTMEWHRRLIAKKTGSYHPLETNSQIRSWSDFLRSAWLNPDTELHYVVTVPPKDGQPESDHNPSRSGPPGNSYVNMTIGDHARIIEILGVYSDEPDWGMDQELAKIDDYHYGDLPLGRLRGPSSQAHFHMCFIADGAILGMFAKKIKTSFMEERIRLFLALSRVAFDHRAPYWGWRFAAWAIHYLQDLTQPYHARLFPVPMRLVIKRFLMDPDPVSFIQKNSNILTNRHHLVEAIVHYLLNRYYKTGQTGPWLKALQKNSNSSWETIRPFMAELAGNSAKQAITLDRTACSMINDPRIESREFHFEEVSDYPIGDYIDRARTETPGLFKEFEDCGAQCLEYAGKATRYVVSVQRGGPFCKKVLPRYPETLSGSGGIPEAISGPDSAALMIGFAIFPHDLVMSPTPLQCPHLALHRGSFSHARSLIRPEPIGQ